MTRLFSDQASVGSPASSEHRQHEQDPNRSGRAEYLQTKNLSPDALVAPFLPPDWTLHAQVKKLTFRDFLTHRTGFNEATDRSDYAGIRQSMQQGPPNPIQAKYCYRNINFATMRLVLPYLNSYNRFTQKVTLNAGSKPDETLAHTYIAIVNQRVLAPSGVVTAGCDSKTLKQPPPQPSLPVLLYEYQQPAKKGVDLGDQTLYCGRRAGACRSWTTPNFSRLSSSPRSSCRKRTER